MTDDYKELLERFTIERKRTGISQHEASIRGGLSMYTISRMETGENIPRTDTFVKMCKGINAMIVIVPMPSVILAERVIIKAIEEKEEAEIQEQRRIDAIVPEKPLDYDDWDYSNNEGEVL